MVSISTNKRKISNKTLRFVKDELLRLKKANLYRTLKIVSSCNKKAVVTVNGIQRIHLCSNDYLGLSQDKTVLTRTANHLDQVSQCSSRLIAGNAPELNELELELAKHRRTQAALVYPSGYMANLGVITAITDSFTTIFSDELNHASIIDACRLSSAEIKVFKHADIDHLASLLKNSRSRRKIIVTESIFSVDGDVPNLKKMCALAKEYNALTVVDDAHGDFIYGGPIGGYSGIPSFLGVERFADIYTSSLSKALGCFGGYVAGSTEVREILINKSRPFIYSSGLPPHMCVSALTAIPIANKESLHKRLFYNIDYVYTRLIRAGFNLGKRERAIKTQIIPIIIGSERLAVDFANRLLEHHIFIQPLRYPTVLKGTARLRISLTAALNKDQLAYSLDSIQKIGKTLHVI